MYQWLWKYVRPYCIIIGFALVLCLVTVGLAVSIAPLSGLLIDTVVRNGQINLLYPIIAIMLALTLLKAIVRYSFQMMLEYCSQGILKNIREDLYRLLQSLGSDFFDKTKTGDIMSLMTGDLEAIRHFYAWVLYQIFENSFIFGLSLIILFSTNWILTITMCVLIPPIAITALKLSKEVKPCFHAIRTQLSRLNSVVQEYIAGNRVVKAFAREPFEKTKFMEENDSFRQKQIDSAKVWGKYIPLIEFFSGCLMALLVTVGGILIIYEKLTIGQFVTFSGLVWAIGTPLRMSGWIINDYRRFTTSLERIYALSLTKSQLLESLSPRSISGIKGNVVLENVSLTLNGNTVLDSISFCVKAGYTVGILGPTGSGKTLLARLLARHFDPTKGKILLDGYDLKEFGLQDIRRTVGIAFQDVFLFSDTIGNNIAFSNPCASMDAVTDAACRADAHNFIQKTNEGYDTIVGERGVGLSGGQKQRVSLARLLLESPPVMILDDTTSAVDVDTEEHIRVGLEKARGINTMFIIAHRLSSVEKADMIIVLENGKITQRGTHTSLLAERGWYRSVWNHQNGLGEQ